MILGPDAAAQKRKRAVGARHSLRKPQRARILFLREVDGFEALRPDAFYVPGVKEFVRGNRDGHFDRTRTDRRAVRMLHSAAACNRIRPDMEEERVLLEWRAAHQLRFVRGNLFQRIFERDFVPVFAVNDHAKMRTVFIEPKLFGLADVDWGVYELVVVSAVNEFAAAPAGRAAIACQSEGTSVNVTSTGSARRSGTYIRVSAKFRNAWCAFNCELKGPASSHSIEYTIFTLPGVFERGNCQVCLSSLCAGKNEPSEPGKMRAHISHAIRKIANLIQRIPRGKRDDQILLRRRNRHLHLDLKPVLFGMRERNFVVNRRSSRTGCEKQHNQRQRRNEAHTVTHNNFDNVIHELPSEISIFRAVCRLAHRNFRST